MRISSLIACLLFVYIVAICVAAAGQPVADKCMPPSRSYQLNTTNTTLPDGWEYC